MLKPVPTIFSGFILLLFSQQSLEYDTGNGVDIFVYHGQRFNQNANYHNMQQRGYRGYGAHHGQRFNQNANYQHMQQRGYRGYDQYMPEPEFFSRNQFMNFQQKSSYQQPLEYSQPYQHRPTLPDPPFFYYGPPAKYEHPHYHHYHHHHQGPPPPPFNAPPHNHFGSWHNNFGGNYFPSMAEVPSNANNINTGCNGILTNQNQQIPEHPVINPVPPTKFPKLIPTFQPFPNPIPIESSSSAIKDLISEVFPSIAQQGQNFNQHQNPPPPVPSHSVTSPIPVFQPVPIIPTSPAHKQQTTSTTAIPVFQPVPITPETTNDSPKPVADDKDDGPFPDIDVRQSFIDIINNDQLNQTQTQ